MKIGIVTLTGNNNYGNRLQNYALSYVLRKMNNEVETIWDKSFRVKSEIRKFLINTKKIIKNNPEDILLKKLNIEREKNIKKFTDKYIINSKYSIYNGTNKNLNDKFDYFVVGSDQVWNYQFINNYKNYFLCFADSNKTIAYAASFGVSSIPNEYKASYQNGINHISHISVREERGKEIVSELTGRESEVVLDPTMLLTADEWRQVSCKPKKTTEKKYILTYFLGKISNEKEEEIEKIASKNDMEIINLLNVNEPDHYVYGIEEFIYLFDNASLVLTDSFHACVFSIIFNTPFYVFNREDKILNMNSRLDTLLGTFNLANRKILTLNNIKNIFACDYKESYKILKKRQKESMEFLINSIK